MRKIAVLMLLAMLTSACVGQGGGTIQNILTLDVVKSVAEEMNIQAKIPEFARANSDFNWQLTVEPVQTVRELNIGVIDRCQFQLKEGGKDNFSIPVLPANNTETFSIAYHTPSIEFERPCPVVFAVNYVSNATFSTTVAVLQEVEYLQRKAAGTLADIPINSHASQNPLQLAISWGPDGQPILDNSSNQLYVDYTNTGSGTITKLSTGDVVIDVPENMGNDINCDDYAWDNIRRKLTLNTQLDFIQKATKRSTCTFKAKAGQPIDSQSLAVSATYNYTLEGTISVPMLAR
jgi:hypothetical protein